MNDERFVVSSGEHALAANFGHENRKWLPNQVWEPFSLKFHSADGGTRTRTALSGQRILSPLRLPFRHIGARAMKPRTPGLASAISAANQTGAIFWAIRVRSTDRTPSVVSVFARVNW